MSRKYIEVACPGCKGQTKIEFVDFNSKKPIKGLSTCLSCKSEITFKIDQSIQDSKTVELLITKVSPRLTAILKESK